jgi:pyruvate dehydrogenase E2 component (dihydrolipoamide acetyltransferase)
MSEMIVMPRLSDTMEEGTILHWLKGEGEQIRRGEELVEIETDKANMTYESDQAGVLHLIAAEGDTLPVGQPIASVGEGNGEGAGRPVETLATVAPDASAAGAEDSAALPPAETAAADLQPRGEGTAAPGGRIRASPLARRMAREGGIDLHGLHGSGPGGRIVKADVLGAPQDGAAAPGAPAAAPTSAPASAPVGTAPRGPDEIARAKGETREVELSRLQQTVARRMAESKATIPDFTLQIELDMEECVRLRAALKGIANPGEAGEHAPTGEEAVPTYNDMVVKASALALREHPLANGSYRDGKVQLHSRINVGVAVAGEGALVVPTVFDAEEKSLGEIARETRALAGRVRDGSITPPELGGGTFTVSNLGMYGISSFAAIINPPQAAILSVGALAPRAVVRDGQIVARHTMSLTLVSDHRILYGAEAARFLARVRELLEAPAALTL